MVDFPLSFNAYHSPYEFLTGLTDQDISLEALFPRLTEIAQMEIEKTFISSYFVNKHYIHPLLSKGTFMQRCENEAWSVPNRQGLFRGTTKFAGLYFAVVALGAINASSNETSLLQHFCQQFVDPSQTRRARGGPGFTALDFAKYFFGLAKRTLGDLFESSCLESAQSLLLLVRPCRFYIRRRLTSLPRVCFVKIRCSPIAVICIAGWLSAQQRLLVSVRACLLCLPVRDEKLGVPGGKHEHKARMNKKSDASI